MNCTTAQDELGLLVDDELPPERSAALQEHLQGCPVCAAERTRLERLVRELRFSAPVVVEPPPVLWNQIEHALTSHSRPRPWLRLLHRPLAMAASLALLLGAGVFVAVWLDRSAQVAQADLVDYGLLLDGVAKDADASVDRFLKHYQAVRVDADAVAAQAAPLQFAIPKTLSGGYMRDQAYRIRIGNSDAYAATYHRQSDGELVFICFHKPVNKTLLGVHRESHCALAKGSHCVEAGPWQLIHFTDPTTCHCLLSRTTDESLLREMLAAISPQFASSSQADVAH